MLAARRVAAQTIAIAAVLGVRAPAAQEPSALTPQYPPVVTHHQGTFNGKRVSYTATVRETIVPNAAGKSGCADCEHRLHGRRSGYRARDRCSLCATADRSVRRIRCT